MKTAVPCYYHLDVEADPERVGQVKRILTAHLRYWDLDPLVNLVCDGVGLLLEAIGEHATDKSASVELWWNGQHLITAVAENDRDLRPDLELRGCLERIAAQSDGWGCCATGTGSQVIWFSQRARDGERVPLVPTAPEPRLREVLPLPRALPLAAVAAAAPWLPEHLPDRVLNGVPDRVLNGVPHRVLNGAPDRDPEGVPERVPRGVLEGAR